MPVDRTARPRQDPVSCSHCRKKKLKCDRLQPCANCHTRGIVCEFPGRSNGDPTIAANTTTGIDAVRAENVAIRARLAKLESIVLGLASGSITSRSSSLTISSTLPPDSPHIAARVKAFADESRMLENVGLSENTWTPNLAAPILLRLGEIADIARTFDSGEHDPRIVLLPRREIAQDLFESYVKLVDSLQHVIYIPRTREMIQHVYDGVEFGTTTDSSHVSLILIIMSTIAAYLSWEEGGSHFASRQMAYSVAMYWLRSVMNLLDQSRRCNNTTLETVQTYDILGFLLYHMESFTPKVRYCQALGVAAAKDIGLHVTDNWDRVASNPTRAQIIDIELRRRVWWHICASDWSLALCGGGSEASYAINPRHMRVKKPRNINDDDLLYEDADFCRPLSEATTMTYYLHRIRLGEASLAVSEVMWEIMGREDLTDYLHENVMAADRHFEALFNDMPPILKLEVDVDVPLETGTQIAASQRFFANLTIRARRCKLHMPFLLRVSQNPLFHTSRNICLQSAREMIGFRRMINLDQATDHMATKVRLNGVIHHFFCAIIVLVMDLCVNEGAMDNAPRKAEVEAACAILEHSKESSPVATMFFDSLRTTLRRHKIRILGLSAEDEYRTELANSDVVTTVPSDLPAQAAGLEQVDRMDFDSLWETCFNLDVTVGPNEWGLLFDELSNTVV